MESNDPTEPATLYQLPKSMMRDFCRAAMLTGLLNVDEALLDAARRGRADMVQALLDGGANVHKQVEGEPSYALYEEPIVRAAFSGNAETVQVLIAAGADVRTGVEKPLLCAARAGHAEVVKVLLAAGAGERYADTAMQDAIGKGHAGVVQAFLDAGMDVHGPSGGDQWLSDAVYSEQADVVRILLAAGADVSKAQVATGGKVTQKRIDCLLSRGNADTRCLP